MGPAVPFGSAYGVEEYQAHGALRHAAIVALDEALMDVAVAARARRARLELASTRALPARYEDLYDVEFVKRRLQDYPDRPCPSSGPVSPLVRPVASGHAHRTLPDQLQWAIALAVVGLKLAQLERMPLACVAEQLALNAMIVSAGARARDHGAAPPAFGTLGQALGDNRFLALFDADADVDGDLRFEAWFDGFSPVPYGAVHPFYPARAGSWSDGREPGDVIVR
jgi:hypothetical protein